MFLRHLAFSTLIILPACASSRPPWADGAEVREPILARAVRQDLGRFEARALALHNRERAAVGAPPLAWDAGLAAAASSYAAELARRGQLVHSSSESRPAQGENLWMGTRGAYSPEEMIGSWINERRLFRPGIFPNVSSSGHWSDVGHYTQIIWRSTARLGCALQRGARADFLVCRYSLPGNVLGQPVI